MFQDKFVFAQLVAFLNRSKFNRIVTKYNGDKYVKHLTCWNQFLAMMFGQLSNRESLRDLIVALEAHHSKCYHLGMGKNVSKSSLARANQDRKNIKEKQKHLIENILLQRIPPDQLHSCHRNLTIIGSGTNRWQECLHPPLLLTPKIFVYERSPKDDTSYCDKMLHLTKVRSYIFRRMLVYENFWCKEKWRV